MKPVRRQKIAKEDFAKENLPHDRKELYFDVIKQRYRLLFGMGLLFALGLLPTLLTFFFSEMNESAIASSYAGVADEAQLLEEASLIRQSRNMHHLFLLPSFAFLALLLGPIYRVYRLLCLGKGIHVWDDFKLGIKQNFLPFLAVFLFDWLLLYLTLMVFNSDLGSPFVQCIPLGFYLALVCPWTLVALALIATYQNGFGELVKNSFFFYLKAFFWLLLLVLASLLPFFLFLIPNYLIGFGIFLLFAVFYYPLLILASYFLLYAKFDEAINKEKYPSLYHKGLY